MGSLSGSGNLLEYLRSRTQVDYDGLNIQAATELGPFSDCTSNQADSYTELLNPQRAALLKKCAALGRQIQPEFPEVTFEELAVEISMISCSLTIAPLIAGAIHVMANPAYAHSTQKVVENGQRLYRLCQRLEPSFDTSRLIIKVASTWEGLQACGKLKLLGVKTLATTLFSMEQAILAAEVGCISISPFVHELKVHFDSEYHDTDPIFDLCVQAQQYYEQHSYPTKVKACSVLDVDEVMRLAGVVALTLPPSLLQALSTAKEPQAKVEACSLFNKDVGPLPSTVERKSYVNDEAKYRELFSQNENGKAQAKTNQAIEIFCEYQRKAEALMRDTDLTHIG